MCGNSANGENKFTFLDVVPDGRVVCARCEAAAIEAGLPSSSEICGRHVCIGGVKAVSPLPPRKNGITTSGALGMATQEEKRFKQWAAALAVHDSTRERKP